MTRALPALIAAGLLCVVSKPANAARNLFAGGSSRASSGSGQGGAATSPAVAVSDPGWLPPDYDGRERARPYLATLYAAEDRNNIPRGLLVRIAWQESRFRPEIIDGTLPSRAGAVGLMQIMPGTARDPGYGVRPISNRRDPFDSIRFAGEYLAAMYARTNDWALAVAAYNNGLGNARRPRSQWHAETLAYVRDVGQDLPQVFTV